MVVAGEGTGDGRLAGLVRAAPGLELAGVAGTPEAALDVGRRTRPHVALVESDLPGDRGRAAAQALHDDVPATRIVALSAAADRGSVLAMLQAGAVSYLLAGTSDERIVQTVRRTAEGASRLATEVTRGVVDELVQQLDVQARAARVFNEKFERIEAALRDEIVNVCFQPVLDLSTRAVIGFEALARFTRPPTDDPEHWFREAAESGLTVELEIAAVESALLHLDRMPAGASLMINVSPSLAVIGALERLLVPGPAERVVIEITEHAPVEDYDAFNDAVAGLRRAGTRLAVDDAGAGFASLRHILRLAPDVIKLDIELTRGIDQDPVRHALGVALASFAADIGAGIIAEGIETAGELAALRDLGIPWGQGYFLGRPAPLTQ